MPLAIEDTTHPGAHDLGVRPRAARPLEINGVVVEEQADARTDRTDRLRWVLLTREPVAHEEQIRQVVRYDELRWRIEEFHKAWKSGVGVERQRLQCTGHLERMWVVISAFVAARLLQLHESLRSTAEPGTSTACSTALTRGIEGGRRFHWT